MGPAGGTACPCHRASGPEPPLTRLAIDRARREALRVAVRDRAIDLAASEEHAPRRGRHAGDLVLQREVLVGDLLLLW